MRRSGPYPGSLVRPTQFNCGFLLLWYSASCSVESLSLLSYSPFYNHLRWYIYKVRIFMRANLSMSWCILALRVRLNILSHLGHPDFLADCAEGDLLLYILFCSLYFMLIFVKLSCLFLAALWSPAWKELTSSKLSCVLHLLMFLSLSHVMFRLRYGTWLYEMFLTQQNRLTHYRSFLHLCLEFWSLASDMLKVSFWRCTPMASMFSINQTLLCHFPWIICQGNILWRSVKIWHSCFWHVRQIVDDIRQTTIDGIYWLIAITINEQQVRAQVNCTHIISKLLHVSS